MPAADMQTLASYFDDNPWERGHIRAPLVCPRHGTPTVTVMGFASRMDVTPTGDFLEDAAENPCCLMVGEYLKADGVAVGLDPKRLVYCTVCEDGMAARSAARSAEHHARGLPARVRFDRS